MSNKLKGLNAFYNVDWVSRDDLDLSIDVLIGRHLNLRGDPADRQFMDAARGALGQELPVQANTFWYENGVGCAWLGPDEWLVFAEAVASDLITTLQSAVADSHCSVVDVSGANACLELIGQSALELLSMGCPIDLHPSVFKPNQCAQTVLAKTGITLLKVADPVHFILIVRRSFAGYLADWLNDAVQKIE